MRRSTIALTIICSVCIANMPLLYSQSFDNIKEQAPVQMNGAVSTSHVHSFPINDSLSARSYSGYYTGSLNTTIYGVNIPFSFTYTNNQSSFSHPFNQYGLQPSYKWIQGYIGYSSMSFSPYTMNGFLFYGVGVELTPPGIFQISSMFGRLQKTVFPDTTLNQIEPAHKRMAHATKIGIHKNQQSVSVNFLRAYDVKSFAADTNLGYPYIPTQENAALSLEYSTQLAERISLQGEFASSYITKDTHEETVKIHNEIMRIPLWFMTNTASTFNRKAFKTSIQYTQGVFLIGLGYERVDPEYQTFGAYYFTNNLENSTLQLALQLFNNKFSVSGNTGLQRDNLDNKQMNNTLRLVASTQLQYTATEKLQLSASYSNFASYTNVRSTFDYINAQDPYSLYDTLNFRQISQSSSFSSNYNFGSSQDKSQQISISGLWQETRETHTIDSVQSSYFLQRREQLFY